ncbi:hypothetical protein MPTK1_4g16180 [Marchantia polymorpha subsp. ruderalis]|uniref:Uncharacterized protein n=2 Tax=Marchantia polymorpha TaxID=3197 RepID=A0AAF6BAF4_MARPO|nr:hypothetical protein MARPO_0054s0083 [Marchantia polymorpha]BBN08988.1 hypothetical protein Mp_4g16180 [Marchantia polymorpha subsp. ruderalis]|eukprot:PTQ37975.1 hypothetical protein MARPO_0054s0083 [Marchantia polymorpha]
MLRIGSDRAPELPIPRCCCCSTSQSPASGRSLALSLSSWRFFASWCKRWSSLRMLSVTSWPNRQRLLGSRYSWANSSSSSSAAAAGFAVVRGPCKAR